MRPVRFDIVRAGPDRHNYHQRHSRIRQYVHIRETRGGGDNKAYAFYEHGLKQHGGDAYDLADGFHLAEL